MPQWEVASEAPERERHGFADGPVAPRFIPPSPPIFSNRSTRAPATPALDVPPRARHAGEGMPVETSPRERAGRRRIRRGCVAQEGIRDASEGDRGGGLPGHLGAFRDRGGRSIPRAAPRLGRD